MIITIKDFLNASSAVTPQAGEPIYTEILAAIKEKKEVLLDFSGMEFMTTAFLNSAIGQLYSELNPEEISNYLKVQNISHSNAFSLKKVIDTAKIYFKHSNDFED